MRTQTPKYMYLSRADRRQGTEQNVTQDKKLNEHKIKRNNTSLFQKNGLPVKRNTS